LLFNTHAILDFGRETAKGVIFKESYILCPSRDTRQICENVPIGRDMAPIFFGPKRPQRLLDNLSKNNALIPMGDWSGSITASYKAEVSGASP